MLRDGHFSPLTRYCLAEVWIRRNDRLSVQVLIVAVLVLLSEHMTSSLIGKLVGRKVGRMLACVVHTEMLLGVLD